MAACAPDALLPLDVWRSILSYAPMSTLYALRSVYPRLSKLIANELMGECPLPVPVNELDEYVNYYATSSFDSTHMCRHRRRGTHILTHERKNVEGDIMYVRLELCALCYARAFWVFYTRCQRLPQLRSCGSKFRLFLIDFRDNVKAQSRWARNARFWELARLLPTAFHVLYRMKSQAYTSALGALQRVLGSMGVNETVPRPTMFDTLFRPIDEHFCCRLRCRHDFFREKNHD
jgi:hypothetical protein